MCVYFDAKHYWRKYTFVYRCAHLNIHIYLKYVHDIYI